MGVALWGCSLQSTQQPPNKTLKTTLKKVIEGCAGVFNVVCVVTYILCVVVGFVSLCVDVCVDAYGIICFVCFMCRLQEI